MTLGTRNSGLGTHLFSVDDLDLNSGLDDSDRIDLRVAHGVYRVTHNKREVGEELWGIFRLKSGGYRLMSEIDLRWPVHNQQRARYDLNGDWTPRELWVQIDAEGVRRMATYAPDGDAIEVAVQELPLRYADVGKGASKNAAKAALRAQRDNNDRLREAVPARTVLETRVPKTPATFLDFGSTLFNFAHLRALRLKVGGAAPMTAVVPSQPSLAPLIVRQTYTFTRVEQIANAINGYTDGHRYVITEEDERAPLTTLWTDHHDITLRQEIIMGAETHGCELVSYTWNE